MTLRSHIDKQQTCQLPGGASFRHFFLARKALRVLRRTGVERRGERAARLRCKPRVGSNTDAQSPTRCVR
jgi:hypothetical protein